MVKLQPLRFPIISFFLRCFCLLILSKLADLAWLMIKRSLYRHMMWLICSLWYIFTLEDERKMKEIFHL